MAEPLGHSAEIDSSRRTPAAATSSPDLAGLDLYARTLEVADTRVVVAGEATDSDGKSDSGVRTISLDAYTTDLLRAYVTNLDTGINPKILSDRIGRSDLSVTFQIYGHRSVGQDREAAELIAKLIRETLERGDN